MAVSSNVTVLLEKRSGTVEAGRGCAVVLPYCRAAACPHSPASAHSSKVLTPSRTTRALTPSSYLKLCIVHFIRKNTLLPRCQSCFSVASCFDRAQICCSVCAWRQCAPSLYGAIQYQAFTNLFIDGPYFDCHILRRRVKSHNHPRHPLSIDSHSILIPSKGHPEQPKVGFSPRQHQK